MLRIVYEPTKKNRRTNRIKTYEELVSLRCFLAFRGLLDFGRFTLCFED